METRKRRSGRFNPHTPVKPSPLNTELYNSTVDFGFEESAEFDKSRDDADNVFMPPKQSSTSSSSLRLLHHADGGGAGGQSGLANSIMSPFKQGVEMFLQSPGPQAIHKRLKQSFVGGGSSDAPPAARSQRSANLRLNFGDAQGSAASHSSRQSSNTKGKHSGLSLKSDKSVRPTLDKWLVAAQDQLMQMVQKLESGVNYTQQFLRNYGKVVGQILALSAAILALMFLARYLVNSIVGELESFEPHSQTSSADTNGLPGDQYIQHEDYAFPSEQMPSPQEEESNELELFQRDSDSVPLKYLTLAVNKLFNDRMQELEMKIRAKQTIFDVKETADYALLSGGASVVKELTSKTVIDNRLLQEYQLSKTKWALLKRMLGFEHQSAEGIKSQINSWLNLHGPNIALSSDIEAGKCWMMRMVNGRGQLTIQLSQPIMPVSFSVEHIFKEVALKGDISDAPKSIQVFGLFQDPAAAHQNYISLHQKAELLASIELKEEHLSQDYVKSDAESIKFHDSLISRTFTFDANISDDLRAQINQIGGLKYIQFRIQSNFGNPQKSCIYRLRVHGH
ncbi:hypothetical protein MIR68_007314 [Amoeboaphelidium protococcarum]|nr:hypothetical protein MIR68_007314 [Amoeboaphelidium protococcarum]KAI3643936.1 hypothetical protein MP228_010100 [Amoeboaphelidium protococcarum]